MKRSEAEKRSPGVWIDWEGRARLPGNVSKTICVGRQLSIVHSLVHVSVRVSFDSHFLTLKVNNINFFRHGGRAYNILKK